MDGRERNARERGVLRVVKSNEPQVARDAQADLLQRAKQSGRRQVVGANHRVPTPASHE